MSLKNIAALLLVFVIGASNTLSTFAQSSTQSVKAEVERRIKTSKEKVVVEMTNGSKRSGKLVSSMEDGFVLSDEETGQSQTISYNEVKRVRGRGLGRTAKIAIGVGVAGVVTFIAFGIAFKNATRNN